MLIDIDWTHVFIWIFVFVFIIFFKYIVTYFMLLRKHETVVLGDTSNYDQTRRQIVVWGIAARQNCRSPPPEFSVAIKESLPISYIDIEDPPPKYEDCVSKFRIEKESPQKSIHTEEKDSKPHNPL